MQNEFAIDQLKAWIKTKSSITSITGERVYRWQPYWTPDGIYITLELSSEQQTSITKATRVVFRFQSVDKPTTFKELIDLKNIITDELIEGVKTIWTMTVYWVAEWWDLVQLVDEKNRKEIVYSYLFYLTR